MIVVASGHSGVDQFVRDQGFGDLSIVTCWEDVLPVLGDADQLFLGERLPGFRDVMLWIHADSQLISKKRIVLWVGEDYPEPTPSLPESVTLWRGELDAERLSAWCRPEVPPSLRLGRQWVAISLFPYPPVADFVTFVTDWADQRYGSGGWIDLDIGRAELSLGWIRKPYERNEYRFDRMRTQRVNSHHLVPSSPPWKLGQPVPEVRDLDSLKRLSWPWQGWYLGTQIARRDTIYLMREIAEVILWASSVTPAVVVQKTVEYCRVCRPDSGVWLVSSDRLESSTAQVAQRLGIQCVVLSERPLTATGGPVSRTKSIRLSLRKKE